ncbi:hypothetical protein BX666DRAFT_1990025 [Dichotomocladium elegans]|nr:hypothetical protein BX666DRAFT_1990025 [Dichotomocladium elegans]
MTSKEGRILNLARSHPYISIRLGAIGIRSTIPFISIWVRIITIRSTPDIHKTSIAETILSVYHSMVYFSLNSAGLIIVVANGPNN